jgi:myo-inositol 2-dehydrogenase / D-chiro-inositol 1-dehydrogenase
VSALRIGVIGAGIMGTDHAELLDGSVSGAIVTAVADVDPARAADLAARLESAQVLASGEDVIRSGACDAVVIASHDTSHAAFTLAAIDAGLPVLCEKPLAPTAAECRAIVAAERAAGRRLVSVGFMRRFDPAYVALKAELSSGRLGDPLLVVAQSRGVTSGPGATSEFSITGSAIHEFDVVPWLVDSELVEVRWTAPERQPHGLADPQVMLGRTAAGGLVTMETYLNARYGYDIRCEILGSAGAAALRDPATVVSATALTRSTGYPADWRPRFREAYRLELQAWIDALRSGDDSPLADAVDGLRATLVAEAAIASMRADGAPVAVEPV